MCECCPEPPSSGVRPLLGGRGARDSFPQLLQLRGNRHSTATVLLLVKMLSLGSWASLAAYPTMKAIRELGPPSLSVAGFRLSSGSCPAKKMISTSISFSSLQVCPPRDSPQAFLLKSPTGRNARNARTDRVQEVLIISNVFFQAVENGHSVSFFLSIPLKVAPYFKPVEPRHDSLGYRLSA